LEAHPLAAPPKMSNETGPLLNVALTCPSRRTLPFGVMASQAAPLQVPVKDAGFWARRVKLLVETVLGRPGFRRRQGIPRRLRPADS
jgi:hypothetical protein